MPYLQKQEIREHRLECIQNVATALAECSTLSTAFVSLTSQLNISVNCLRPHKVLRGQRACIHLAAFKVWVPDSVTGIPLHDLVSLFTQLYNGTGTPL